MNIVKSMFFKIIKRKEFLLYLVIFTVGLNLFGWFSDNLSLTSFSNIYTPISPIGGVSFITLCILFLFNIYFEKSRLAKLSVTFIIIIAFYYSAIFFNWDVQYVFIRNLEKFGEAQTGYISPISSLLFIFICISILSVRQNNSDIIKYSGGSLSLLLFLISSVLLIGYLYKAPLLYGSKIIPVSLPAAIFFMLFSITLLRVIKMQFWSFNLIKYTKVTLKLLKSFLPVIIFIVILEGYLITNLSFNINNPTLSTALILFIVVPITIFLVVKVSSFIGNQLHIAERALGESEKKYRSIVENLGEGIGLVNSDEEFVFANPAADIIFGVGKGELFGKSLAEFFNEEQYITILNQTKIRKSGQSSSYEGELTLRDGNKRNVIITAVPQFDDNKMFIGALGIFRDITELIQYQKQLLKLNLDKDRFISILGHDLKSPFNGLLGLSELLTKNIREYDIDEIEVFVNHINISARKTYNLLEDLLMWVRSQSGKIPFKPQNLIFADLCRNILDIHKPGADAKHITINYNFTDGIIVFADIDMVKTVMRNLVSNAIKFTNNNGTININAEENSEIVGISVSDNGIGIKPDNLTKLFDITQVLTTTGTAEEAGTGLGLLLCKEFVEKHGGTIWVESEVGKGSDFKFTLPIFVEQAV